MMRQLAGALLLLCTAAAAFAQPSMTLDGGLAPYQVLQAAADGTATANAYGSWGSTEPGAVAWRVLAPGAGDASWQNAGQTVANNWEAPVQFPAVGGPYRVEISIATAFGKAEAVHVVENVFVGDVFVLAGQSNMEGVGAMEDVMPSHPRVMMFGHDERWQVAREPMHVLAASIDKVHGGPKTPQESAAAMEASLHAAAGAGVGLPFATELTAMVDRPIGLIPCAHGGTSMAEWSPERKSLGGDSLYGSMLRRFHAAGGKARGVLWYQGESDANQKALKEFKQKFIDLIAAFRADLGDPNLPFLYAQIGRFVVNTKNASWDGVQQAQYEVEQEVPNVAMVTTVDLPLDDLIHVSTPGHKLLGKRFAQRAGQLIYGLPGKPGPRPESITWSDSRFGKLLLVRCSGVNDRLTSAGRVSGFSISETPDGEATNVIFDQEIDPNDPATIRLWLHKPPATMYLWYGRGLDPYCNVVDGAGMALPAFGPKPVPAL